MTNPFVTTALILATAAVIGGCLIIWRVASATADPAPATAKVASPAANLPPVSTGPDAYGALQFGHGRTLDLDKPSMQIGRHSGDDIRIDDVRVSRHHARIDKTPDGTIEIHNLTAVRSEPNPMQVNGVERENIALHDGDVVSLGGVEFVFRSVKH